MDKLHSTSTRRKRRQTHGLFPGDNDCLSFFVPSPFLAWLVSLVLSEIIRKLLDGTGAEMILKYSLCEKNKETVGQRTHTSLKRIYNSY